MAVVQRYLATGAVLAALVLVSGCGVPGGETGNGAAMDSNLAAQADEMEETANSRANAMAGDMMSNAAQAMTADNAAANVTGNNAADPE